jgi:hypothetical protein
VTVKREARDGMTTDEAAAYARGLADATKPTATAVLVAEGAAKSILSHDPIVAAVQYDLARRSAGGLAKYGTTLARTDLSHADWLRHAYEEALDMACYLRRAMEGLQGGEAREAIPAPPQAPEAAGGDPGARTGPCGSRACRDGCVQRVWCPQARFGFVNGRPPEQRRKATGLDYRGG